MTKSSPFESIRKGMETKTGKISAGTLIVLGALGLAGCAQDAGAGPNKSPTSTSSETPGDNGGETTKLTYQQEIQKGIEARPKEGVAINVADYPTLEAAAGAWTDAYFDCLFSGNIQLTPENRSDYVALMKGPIIDNVPKDFKLAENFETCISNLIIDNDYNRELTNLYKPINANIVAQQVANNRVGVVNRNFSVSDVSDSSINARLSFTKRINDANPADILIASKLENIDGKLLSTGPAS